MIKQMKMQEYIEVEEISELLVDLLMIDEERNPIFDDELACQFMINKIAKLHVIPAIPLSELEEILEKKIEEIIQNYDFDGIHATFKLDGTERTEKEYYIAGAYRLKNKLLQDIKEAVRKEELNG